MRAHEKAVEAVAQSIGCTRDDTWEWLKQNKPARVDELQTEAAAAITAYLASMEAQGWVMRCKEPTDAMIAAGAAEVRLGADEKWSPEVTASEVYDAMLAAKEE